MYDSFDKAMDAIGRGAFAGADDLARRLVYQTRAGTPNVDAAFIGQRFFDSSANNWYTAYATGTGASDWKQDSNA